MSGFNVVEIEIRTLLRQHRFNLVSEKKHYKYVNPEGRVYVMAKTPSDLRAYRNQLTTLKRVLASAIPTSSVLEEERQRRELEREIAIAGQERSKKGMTGSGRSNGTGYSYYSKVEVEEQARFIPDEVRAAEIERSQTKAWDREIRRLARQVEKARRDLTDSLDLLLGFHRERAIRKQIAKFLKSPEGRLVRSSPKVRENPRKAAELWVRENLAKALAEGRLPSMLDNPEELFEVAIHDLGVGVDALDPRVLATLRIHDEDVSEDLLKSFVEGAISTWLHADLAPSWLPFEPDGEPWAKDAPVCRYLMRAVRTRRFAKFATLLRIVEDECEHEEEGVLV